MSKAKDLRGDIEESAANAPMHAMITISLMDDRWFTAATTGLVKGDIRGRIINWAGNQIGAGSMWLHQALAGIKSCWNGDARALLALLAQSHLFPPQSHGLLQAGLEASDFDGHATANYTFAMLRRQSLRKQTSRC